MADTKVPSTLHDFDLIDGSTVKLTLTYDSLYKLEGLKPDVMADYNEVMTKGAKTELQMLRVIYTAYLCGLIKSQGNVDGCMDYENFLAMVQPDREYIAATLVKLVAPKKSLASVSRS